MFSRIYPLKNFEVLSWIRISTFEVEIPLKSRIGRLGKGKLIIFDF